MSVVLLGLLCLFSVNPAMGQVEESSDVDSGPSAEQMAAWDEEAREHADKGEYDLAISIYNSILSQYPGTAAALQARTQTAKLYIRSNNIPAAESATDALVREFSQHSETARFLYEIALTYKQNGMAQNANALHQYNVDNFLDSMHAMRSQVEIIGHYIQEAEEAAAHAEFDRLMEIFAAQETLPREVCQIAKRYARADKQDKAIELYQYVATAWPEDEYALWSMQGEAITWIKMYQVVAAQVVIENLLTNFAAHEKLAPALNSIAEAYHEIQDEEMALELYNYVLTNYPANETTLKARMGAAVAYVGLGQDEQVNAAVETLLSEFADHSGLARAIFIIGKEYHFLAWKTATQGNLETAKENFAKALIIWQTIIDQLPESDHAPHAHYFAAVCYKQLEQYTLAVEYFKIVVDRWPDFTRIVPYRIGVLYRSLKEYDEAIEWFKLQRELYPQHIGTAGRALFYQGVILQHHMKEYERAIEIYQEYLDLYPAGNSAEVTPICLAKCYVERGEKTKALEILQKGLENLKDTSLEPDYHQKIMELR